MVYEQLYAGALVAFAAVLMLMQQFRRKSSLKLPPGPLNLAYYRFLLYCWKVPERMGCAGFPSLPCDIQGQQEPLYSVVRLGYLTAELSRTAGKPIKPRQALLVTTANIFYTFFCAERFNPDDPKFLRIVDLYNEVFHQLFQGFAIDFMPWLKVLQGKQLGLLKEKSMEIYRFTLAIMDRREKAMASGIGAGLDQARDLMDVLLLSLKGPRAEGQLDKVEVAVVIEDLIGGHSVIANLWVWCLYILSDYP
ncbi:hypothetical protein MTO96_022257 [Rhipicephalus appendiculatus]